MVILHIARMPADTCSGVRCAVPGHVRAQKRFADTALWNLGERVDLDGLSPVFDAESLDTLPMPYRRPDAAVFHEIYIPRFPTIAKQLRKSGIPYFIVPHGSLRRGAQQHSRLKKTAANLLLFRSFCDRAAGIPQRRRPAAADQAALSFRLHTICLCGQARLSCQGA